MGWRRECGPPARIVNSTPLHEASESPKDSQPITPHHLITQGDDSCLENFSRFTNYNEADLFSYGANRWKRIEALSDEFAKYWKHYIFQIGTDKEKWTTPARNATAGDVVLLKEKAYPRHALTGTPLPSSPLQWIKTTWCERSWCSHTRNQARKYAPHPKSVPFMIWFSSRLSRPRTILLQTHPLYLVPRRKPRPSYALF